MASSSHLNSIRLLTQQKINFTLHEFPDTIHSADGVANYVGLPASQVYKTLVVLNKQPQSKPMLIMVSANQQLNLKNVAKSVGQKKVHMATHHEAESLTGLKVGGISALMLLNKGFSIYIDKAARSLDAILVSAGQRGINVELAVADLINVTKAKWIDAA